MTSDHTHTLAASFEKAGDRLGRSSLADTLLISLLILAAVLPYANALLNGFIFTYDDGTQILKNPYVHSLRYLPQILTTNVWSYLGTNTVTNYYRPVMTLGYLLCYKLFGPVAYGFHLASVVLHSAIVAILFMVTRRLTSDRGLAFGAAALFAFHPIHTEAVDWISAVTELEVTFFFLTAFWLFLEVPRAEGWHSGLTKVGMMACYILALLSKEQALALPLLAVVYEHFYRDDRSRTTWGEKLRRYGELWLLGAAYVLFRIRFLGGFAPLLQRPHFTWYETFLAALALFGQYLWKLLWPVHFSAFYVFPENIQALVPWMIAGAAGSFACFALFAALWKRNRPESFGLLWLLVTLGPVLNARWMANNVFNERYLYLPSIGFCWLLAGGWTAWRPALSERQTALRRVTLAAAGVVLALCAFRIVTRNRDWHDDVTLYTRTLEASPDSPRVMDALGLAYWSQGNREAAEREWRRLLALHPQSSTWNYLGVVLAQKKQYADAVRCFERSLELDPASSDAHLNLGAAYAEQGQMEAAEAQFRAAVALSPLSLPARNVLGKLYFDAGRLGEAEEQFRRSAEIEPNVAACDYLGDIYLRWGDRERAEKVFQKALAVNTSESRAHLSLGAIYAATGRPDQAVQEYLAGLATDPNNSGALKALQELRHRAPSAKTQDARNN
jgi:tetratricopeptide (TPR) repeat protein